MCRICFIIHLIPLVHGNIFLCKNFGQNGDKYTHRRQVDVVGSLGATWAHWPAPQGRRSAPPTLALATSLIRGSCCTSSPMLWFKSVCINGHDGVVLDPWVHYHGLGALQLTSKPLYLPNFDMCRLHNRLWEPTKALQSKGNEIKGRSAPLPRRPEAHFHQTASILDSMHTSTSGAIWCIQLWRFKVSYIQGWRRLITRITDVALEKPLLHLKL
jgi:hypothetical protein